MEVQIVVAITSAAAALFGSAIGGITSYFSTRSMRRMEWHLALKEREINRREDLFTDFITEANRLVISSFHEKMSNGNELATLVALENRLWLYSEEIGALARKIAGCVLNYHQEKRKDDAPNFADLRDKFISTCRSNLAAAKNDA